MADSQREQRESQATVNTVLTNVEKEQSSYKSIDVFKEVEPIIDTGNLLLSDQQPVSAIQLKSNQRGYLEDLARDNAQLLFNEIWKLPVERYEDAIVAKIPKPITVLPREKPIPKAKPPTKWEIFAKKKGIQNKKRERMVWDEVAKEWKPRFGHKRVNDVSDKWLVEIPDQADPYEDQFEKLTKEKKEKVAKNELQRLRNIARNKKGGKILSTELKPTSRKDEERISKEMDVTRTSTASIGKFQRRLPKEKIKEGKGVKRKFEGVSGNTSTERQKALDIWSKLHKPDIMDSNKAANRMIAQQEMGYSASKTKGKRGPGSKVKNRVFKRSGAKAGNANKKRGGKGAKK
ncbi:ribosome biogenesis regulatory protein homolog [Rhopilema esculentum]|uniref:ribosome biogenesis regulatory protein homolog n=1 Tax=Rhopilema esculentum TaxID=499914 RepID=UPI0031DAFEB3